jgi:cytochrome c-type biogenesis protein CcmF
VTALGPIALLAGFAAALYAAIGSVIGARRGMPELLRSARRAAYCTTLFILAAAAALLFALLTHDFGYAYVAQHTALATPWYYRLSSFYSGQQGSLLYWATALSVFSGIVLIQNRKRHRELMPYVTATLMLVEVFFLFILVFVASPFATISPAPPDGQGLNPLLQDPGMLIHPPMLLAGLMSWSVPFAFVVGALATGRLGAEWIRATRRYALVAWCILGIGNLLGAWWSYHVLGWGGYWGWDPVENGAIMPWLVGTAYLHSVMVQERRGMLKLWNVGLLILAFSLSIFGTFVVRSGILNSVHSFAQSSIGPYFFGFLVIALTATLALVYWRMPMLQSEHGIDSPLSREAAFLLNNLLFIGLVFTTFWGTVLPLISEALRGTQMTVGAPFFNQINGPIALGLVLLMGVGPLLPWRRADGAQLLRLLTIPVGGAVVLAAVLAAAGIREPLALIALAACAFVILSVALELWNGVAARRRSGVESVPVALTRLIRRNNRRYGGYCVHLAIVLIGFGIIGSTFYKTEDMVVLRPGQSIDLHGFSLRYQGLQRSQTIDRMTVAAPLSVSSGDETYAELRPSKVTHRNFEDQPPTSGVAIDTIRLKDLYVVLADIGTDGSASLLVWVNPLVSLIWLGGPLLLLGFAICVWPEPKPSRRSVRVPVTEELAVEA